MNERKKYIENRCKEVAQYMIEEQCTVRKAAQALGLSKSMVHTDVTTRLAKIDFQLAKKVNVLLMKNKAERTMRGGMATKAKYQKLRDIRNK